MRKIRRARTGHQERADGNCQPQCQHRHMFGEPGRINAALVPRAKASAIDGQPKRVRPDSDSQKQREQQGCNQRKPAGQDGGNQRDRERDLTPGQNARDGLHPTVGNRFEFVDRQIKAHGR